MVQQPLAGIAWNNQRLHLSTLRHGVDNPPTFYVLDYRRRFGLELTNTDGRPAGDSFSAPGQLPSSRAKCFHVVTSLFYETTMHRL
jgi:hypothetical protein